jgi:hypothetical protein
MVQVNPREFSKLGQAQRERLAYLEMRACFSGELRRADLEKRFGIKPAASTRDLTVYRALVPDNLSYDGTARCYRPALGFKPVFELSAERVLSWLLHGFGDGLDLKLSKTAPCEGAGSLTRPDLSVLASLTRAMCAARAVEVSYLSLSSGRTQRELVPVALADNGLRWHVRAFDRANARFGDFVLTRIESAKVIDGPVAECELLAADEQWARIVDMEVVAHPGVRWPQAVEADYGMKDGVLRLRSRAALAGYVLRRWSIDCSINHSLDPSAHHLWLRNPQTLYGVESAVFAPGANEGSSSGPL